MKKILLTAFLAAAGFALFADEAAAQTAAAAAKGPTAAEAMFTVNNIWMLIGTFLVFTMHLGFALLETGLTRAKNCVNILCKNLATPCIGVLTFLVIGFGLMYPGDSWVLGKFLGFAGAGLNCPPGAAGLIEYNGGNYTYWTDFIFQAMYKEERGLRRADGVDLGQLWTETGLLKSRGN